MNWNNKQAIKVYKELSHEWGKPSILSEKKHGIAIWTKEDMNKQKFFNQKNCFVETIIRDEKVKHLCPAQHFDFLYSYIKINIPPNKLMEVYSLSGSVGYDPLRKLLYARCAHMGANYVTLKLATDIVLDHQVNYIIDGQNITYKGIKDIQNKGLYGYLIRTTFTPEFRKQFYKDLSDNIKKINKKYKLPNGYWIGAFSHKNGQCLPPN